MTQLRRTLWFAALAGVLLLLQCRAAAQTSNGALKVTSFPVGANVSVDGVDTGKVTPMSISLTVGTHTVVVSIPNSGWNPDTRTVEVVAGNNDLSVTLLPIVTAGPPGTPGAAATIQIGGTTTLGPNGQASVANVGTPNAAVLNFAIPQGQTGATGPAGAAATVTVGTTATGLPGTSALVTNAGSSNAALLNFVIPQGTTGAQGPAGPKGDAGPPGAGGGLNGMQDFTSSSTFTVPANVTTIQAELWGAGGGGGFCSAGGGGAYLRTLLSVSPGAVLTITVGARGTPGGGTTTAGSDGGSTIISDAAGNNLASAAGGAGGQIPQAVGCIGVGGGFVTSTTGFSYISRPGLPGGNNSGGLPNGITNPPPDPVFANTLLGSGGYAGSSLGPGSPGYVLLTW